MRLGRECQDLGFHPVFPQAMCCRKHVALKRTVVELRTLLPHKCLVIDTKRFVLQYRSKLENVLEHWDFCIYGISKHSNLFVSFWKQLTKIVRTRNDSSSNHQFYRYVYQVCFVVKVCIFRRRPRQNENAAYVCSRTKIAMIVLDSKKKLCDPQLKIDVRVYGGKI